MMSFLVMPEDIQVKESFAAEWAHQPHSLGALSRYGHKQLPMRLMGPPHSPQPGIDTPAWQPQLNSEGLHVSWYVFPQC